MLRRASGVGCALIAALLFATACSSSSSSTATTKSGTSRSITDTTHNSVIDPASIPAKPSPGCSSATTNSLASPGTNVVPGAPAGETKVTITSDGASRWYFQHLPANYDPTKPEPLVLDFHGYEEGAQIHLAMSNLSAYGDSHGFITVTPEGDENPFRWNADLKTNDDTFVDHAEATLCVDERRVYATGLSNGAFMTSTVACVFSDRIAAAAPVAGLQDIPGCTFKRPVPVVTFHGTADPFLPYDGGLGPAVASLASPDGSGKPIGTATSTTTPGAKKPETVPQMVAAWAKRNGCGTTPRDTTIASDVTLITFPCPKGHEVELYRIDGGGHAWPGSEFSKGVKGVVGYTTFSISANEVMWRFFQAHPLPVNA
jgi:polyhydroxybutyrate depolymerase